MSSSRDDSAQGVDETTVDDQAGVEAVADNEGFAQQGEHGPVSTVVDGGTVVPPSPVVVDPMDVPPVPTGTVAPGGTPSGVRKPPYPGELYSGAEGPWLAAMREAIGYTSDDEGFREDDRQHVAEWQAANRRMNRNGYPDRGDWDAIFEGV